MKWVYRNRPPRYKLTTLPLKVFSTTLLSHAKLNLYIYDFTGYAAKKRKVNSAITCPQVCSTGETKFTKHHPPDYHERNLAIHAGTAH